MNLQSNATVHGMRSTFRDWCAENNVDKVLAEKALMHSTGNKTEQAYQRSDLLEERRKLMQEWAEALFEENVSQKGETEKSCFVSLEQQF